MMKRYLMACFCIGGLAACDPPESENDLPTAGGETKVTLNRDANGNLEYCDANGDCQALPYAGDCARIEITIDTATGQTCQTCITADGSRIDEGCNDSLIACVVVTLPNPDCVVCAYVNGSVIYSSCVAEAPQECSSVCSASPGVEVTPCSSDADCATGLCVEGYCDAGPMPEPSCCEQCTDAYGRLVYDSCTTDCSAVVCEPIACAPGYTPRRMPGDCCDYCVPVDDCDQAVCPMFYPVPECPPGSTLVQDPSDCCNYYCQPTECAIAHGSGPSTGGGGDPAVPYMCMSNEECSAGNACVNGLCMTVCNVATDCPAGAACVEGVCQPIASACTVNADCPAGQVCREGVCTSDCPPGYHFETAYPYCGQCVADPSEVSCYSDMDCAPHEYCAYDNCSSSGGDPTFVACAGLCRPRDMICDDPGRAPPYCEGAIATQYDGNGCPYYVCVCPDGTISLDGVCTDACADVYCIEIVVACDPGYHPDFSYPYCCGVCVPDQPSCDATGAPHAGCLFVECAQGYHEEIDPLTCCPACYPDSRACLADTECAAGQRCDVSYCEPAPGCDPVTEVCVTLCYGTCVAAECAIEECGPALGMPNTLCPDGSVGGPTGRCLRNADGTCGWEVVECPAGTCVDSDGADPYVAGSATESTPSSAASCSDRCSADGSAVIECICTTDGLLVTTTMGCDHGCGDGACFGQMCGGFAGFPCPDGYTCVDDPRDSCDPAAGGADCAGTCVR